MDDLFYLLNISFFGIKNISKEIRLDFYSRVVNKSFNPSKHRVKAIYGENGAGKTAIITAVDIAKSIITMGHYLDQADNQLFLDEIINKETGIFSFVAEILYKETGFNTVYKYSFSIGKKTNRWSIINEELHVKNGNSSSNKYKAVYKIIEGSFVFMDCQNSDIYEREYMNLLDMNTFTSLLMPYESVNDVKYDDLAKLNDHVMNVVIVFDLMMVYFDREDMHRSYLIRKLRKTGKYYGYDFFSGLRINSFVFENGVCIVPEESYVFFEKYVKSLESFLRLFKPSLKRIIIDKKEDKDIYRCELIIQYDNYSINSEFESTGIKKLIRLYDCLRFADIGGISFIDEMDSNINDIYLCKMIEYFMQYGKGQLCFTTHNLDPMMTLKDNKNSIDFISSDNHIVPWTKRGRYSPDNCYRNGTILGIPFNIEATDFLGIFGD